MTRCCASALISWRGIDSRPSRNPMRYAIIQTALRIATAAPPTPIRDAMLTLACLWRKPSLQTDGQGRFLEEPTPRAAPSYVPNRALALRATAFECDPNPRSARNPPRPCPFQRHAVQNDHGHEPFAPAG